MKEMYIIFNSFTENYIYYETPKEKNEMKNRKEFKESGKSLTEKISFINKKRNSILHLIDIKEEDLKELKKYFLYSKVRMQLD